MGGGKFLGTIRLTKKHRSYFKAAKAISELSDFRRVQLGCVAVYGHRVISSGYNTCKSSPLQKEYNKYRFDEDTNHTLHSETKCLLPLINRNDVDFSKISLYVYREFKNGGLALARPCESCMKLIRDLGIRDIYYTNNGGYSHEEVLY